MADTFKPGDVVQLKSGGPKMTVYEVDGKRILCEWFAGGKLESAGFEYATLVKVEQEEKSKG